MKNEEDDVEKEGQRFTREEFYELVWSEPLRTLAPRFGISDVAMAKTCRRHKVPRPWRGYWQRKRHGKPVRRARLRPLRPEEVEELGTVVLGPPSRRRLEEAQETGPVADQKRYEAEHPIVVRERMGRPHALVRETRECLRARRRGDWRYEDRHHTKALDIQVDTGSLPRALRIMNALIRALEQRGFSVAIEGDDGKRATVVHLRDTTLAVCLKERRKQVLVPPEEDSHRLFSWDTRPRRELEYTGELRFIIDDFWSGHVRKTWSDGKRRKLEEALNDVVVGLVRAAESKKERLRQREEEERKREEERRRRIEAERLRRAEEQRGQRLEQDALAWATANRVREYVEAVRERAQQEEAVEEGGELAGWFLWAAAYADQLDPTLHLPPASISAAPEEVSEANPWPSWYGGPNR